MTSIFFSIHTAVIFIHTHQPFINIQKRSKSILFQIIHKLTSPITITTISLFMHSCNNTLITLPGLKFSISKTESKITPVTDVIYTKEKKFKTIYILCSWNNGLFKLFLCKNINAIVRETK